MSGVTDSGIRKVVHRLRPPILPSSASVWAESGLGAPVDIDQLQRQIALLEQDLSEKPGELEERTEELEAARAANRELTRSLNHRS